MTTTTVSAAAARANSSASARIAVFAYGVGCYAVGVTGLCWLIGATLGLAPYGIAPLALESAPARVLFNLAWVALFGIQHAIMARKLFKQRWAAALPAATCRATFVLLAGAIMSAAMWTWQPLSGTAWSIESGAIALALRGIQVLGWAYLFAASFAIDHFELFGLRQVWMHLRSKVDRPVPFVQRFMYRFDRHPLMSGILIGLWVTPVMSMTHLVLAAGFTTYLVLGVAIEERDLIRTHGDSYREYRRRVGSLVPKLARD